ncbi:MAG: MBL fold metallo-hydrolase [Planctomycetota bacterium]
MYDRARFADAEAFSLTPPTESADAQAHADSASGQLTRRGVLAGLGAVGGAMALGAPGAPGLAPRRAFAQDAPAPRGGPIAQPGVFTFDVESIRVSVIHDGWFPFQPAHPTIGTNAPAEEVHQALWDNFIPPGEAIGDVHAVVIQTGDRLVLVDTGCGAAFGPNAGNLLSHLRTFGAEPGDVDTLVLTHLHPDHVGGLFVEPNTTWLPKARLVLHEAEHAFWIGEPDFAKSGVPDAMRPAMTQAARGALQFFEGRTDLANERFTPIAPGLELRHIPGHTPGHCGIEISDEKASAFFVADLIHCAPVQFAHPDWHIAFDTDPERAADTRVRVLDEAASGRTLVFGSHLPFPALGHVKKTGDEQYDWRPAIWRNDAGGPGGAAYQAG